MKRLIILGCLVLGGCSSLPSDQYDEQARNDQIYYLNTLEENEAQLKVNLAENAVRDQQEANYKDWAAKEDAKREVAIAKQEEEQFSYNIGRGLGTTSKCTASGFSNDAIYRWMKSYTIAEAKKRSNYNASQVQAGFEDGVQIGVYLAHNNPIAFAMGCNQMNEMYNANHSAGNSKVSDFQ